MQISICNFTSKSDEEVQKAIRAINGQIEEDFAPYWGFGACLRLDGRSSANLKKPKDELPGLKQSPQDLRGDAILYLWDSIADVANALGYHDMNNRGLPFGFVFTQLSEQLGESWTVTLSHEALELIGDANVNLLAAGPHPQHPDKLVFHWYEMCDAVQDEHYEIDGVPVSNFVLPLYFTVGDETGARNDFLNRAHSGKTLTSFGINPGGYIGFFDAATGQSGTVTADKRGQDRLRIKGVLKGAETRRGKKYEALPTRAERRSTNGRRPVAAAPPARGKVVEPVAGH